ncbi:MAG: TIGR03905 family TSCPD domain-containing protein [Firmicutes bacterium]|nr:TIGR03905 family TSCPD domain-containing protein [Bacillota bacterium]
MEKYTYTPTGVCAKQIVFELDEEGKIHSLSFTGGCNGNLKAIGRLAEGQSAKNIADILRGNQCGIKGTSCADQLAQAIDQVISER